MNLTPLTAEYIFSLSTHTIRATTRHQNDERILEFYYDDKLISSIKIPNGELLSDDDYIMQEVENHCKSSIDAYSDLFNNHRNKIFLVSKEVKVIIDNFGIEIIANVKVFNNRYEITLSTPNGEDSFTGTFKSNSFSEVLEKLRLFINTLSGVSNDLSANIDELTSDRVEQYIKWI